MNRLLLLTILISMVYSWEELKAVLIMLVRRGRHKGVNEFDQAVGNALILATTPPGIVWIITGEGSLTLRLGFVLAQLVFIIVLMEIVSMIRNRYFHESVQFAANVSKLVRRGDFVSQFAYSGKPILLYIKTLLIPILLGIMMKSLIGRLGLEGADQRIDQLIMVAVFGMILIATINALTKFFRFTRLNLFGYFRIVLGLVLFLILTR